ncbi:MAG TPA: NADH-quinone oxidoreductase subunit L [Vicinamibacterales bacterium]|nr:NADH-quinone oxidoreductase subunit L [Vicinamibacterales bacterium]
MIALIPLFPLLGFAVNASMGRRLPKTVSGGLASLVMLASFAVSVAAVWQVANLAPAQRAIEQTLYTWIASGDFVLDLTLRVDPLASVMILVITGIGSLIHIYSTAYMHEESDREYARYFSYLNLFAAFMLVLVLGANFLVLFVGWEGVGLCSYLLIGFWFEKRSAADAGKKAFVVNRIGDYAFILGTLLLFVRFGTLDFQRIASAVAPLGAEPAFGLLSVGTLLLFIGATGKSAQIPLYVWLPDAMEGPTPVSALIHAATMVTAGVYMIGRNAVLFRHAPETMAVVAVIGAATALMAGTIGLVQNDIKRVLAYSTVSQLGYMFLAMGVGAFGAGIFHLYTHAFFKACLFLGSGAVIHALHGEQDIRNMGGLKAGLPITYWTFLIGSLAIAGVPLLAGFFSKDEILFETFARGHVILWTIGILTSLLTATYMFRLVFLTFHGERRHDAPAPAHAEEEEPAAHRPGSDLHQPAADLHRPAADLHQPGAHLHDAPPAMALALIVLALGSVLAGYIGVPHALGGGNALGAWLAPSFAARSATTLADQAVGEVGEPGAGEAGEAGGGLELSLMVVSSIVALVGIGLAAFIWLRRREIADKAAASFPGVYRLLLNKYYVDEVYDATIVQPIRIVSQEGLWRGIDVNVIDGAVNGTASIVDGSSSLLRRLQSGSVRAYAGSLLIGVVLILGYYLWR